MIRFSNNILYECAYVRPYYLYFSNTNGLTVERYSCVFAIRKLSLRERIIMLLGHYGF